MEKEQMLEMIKKEMGEVPKVLQDIADLDLDFLKNHFTEKKNAYSGDSLDKKTKAIIALGVGVAVDSNACIANNIKAAKKNGATNEEIFEALKVAKFAKSASVMSSLTNGISWLLENKDEVN